MCLARHAVRGCMGQCIDGHGRQGMLENDGVLFWKHATRKKWAEKHAVSGCKELYINPKKE